MDLGEVDEVRSQVDALVGALSAERFAHVAGLSSAPALVAAFDAHGVAATRGTVEALRERGEKALAARVAGLAATPWASNAAARAGADESPATWAKRSSDSTRARASTCDRTSSTSPKSMAAHHRGA